MRTIILAGGLGTRLSEETVSVPKPMVTIGGKPMLWHIMKIYSHYGHRDFVLCLGYKGEVVKEWLLNLDRFDGSFEIDLSSGALKPLGDSQREPWTVMALETGGSTQTGGRLKRALQAVEDDEVFVTYGDGVADVDLDALLAFHRSHGKLATLTATYPPGRFGALNIQNCQVHSFKEKPRVDGAFINGGFFVLSPKVLSLLNSDNNVWEQEPLTQLAQMGELMAFEHSGFWQPMDTLRDKNYLEELWATGKAPWKKW